jgi:PAS domain S-box-containing protein
MENHIESNHSDLKGHSVLIIDDDPSNLGAVSEYLGHIGLEALVARDGASGLEKARYARPDLILLDVRLPGADGFEICDRLKTEETTKEIPVIFMTALTKTEHKIKGFKAGGVDYITKPLQFEEVLARVATHLQLHDLRLRLEQKVCDRTAQLTTTNQKLEQEIADHQQTAAALKASETRYRCLFEESPISLWEEDFSKVRQYFDQLRASGSIDFRAYFETHPEAVVHCARLVRVVDTNKATLELLGTDDKKETMTDLANLFTEASLTVFREELITLACGGLKFQSEASHRRLTGEQIHVVLCLRVAPGYETSLGNVMISVLDITDRKRAEEQLTRQREYLEKQAVELIRAKEEAEAAVRAKDRFLANISHELRTPLNPILGFAQILRRQPNLTGHQRRQLSAIHASGQHLLTLIDDILNFCHKNNLPTKSMAAEFNLPQLIQEIKVESHNKAAQKGLSFFYEEPAAIPERILGHEGKLKQVLLKLLDNALKFTVQGGITLRTLCTGVSTAAAGQPAQRKVFHIQFQVADTGPGISEDKLETIFESFSKAPSNGQWTAGVGLGLTICRQLVTLMGGTIAVESKIGQGSIFTVDLDLEAMA